MPSAVDFHEGICNEFLRVIPVRITVPCNYVQYSKATFACLVNNIVKLQVRRRLPRVFSNSFLRTNPKNNDIF